LLFCKAPAHPEFSLLHCFGRLAAQSRPAGTLDALKSAAAGSQTAALPGMFRTCSAFRHEPQLCFINQEKTAKRT
jgi:hypothetical protein